MNIEIYRIPKIFPVVLLCMIATVASAFSAALPGPSQSAVNAAIAARLVRYGRNIPGGAYTDGAWDGGGSIVLAVASYTGNTSADDRLLEQIHYTLTAGNEICANGGYPAQHERHVTGMFAIVKNTPRIWNQLTSAEKTKTDLMMKAGLVASAFTTAENNPYVQSGSAQYTLDGDGNLHRDWGPNYREGMIGGMLVGMVYFGGPAAAESVLDNYNHSQFVSELAAKGLPNTYEVFNWKAAHSSSNAPSGTAIRNAVDNYEYYGYPLDEYLEIYWSLLAGTYGGHVNAGLNGGSGIGGWGRIVSGAADLPNQGVLGMLREFDTIDGGGARSSLIYAYDGFRPHQTNILAMIAGGYWDEGGEYASAAIERITIGNTDLWYKIEKGYYSYAKGNAQGVHDAAYINNWGFPYVRSLWEDVLKPFHDSASEPGEDIDSDGDGTSDAVEELLGLDPSDGASRFAATLTDGVLGWPSAAGLSFTVQRSDSDSGMEWEDIATVPGASGSKTFTDPSPPSGGKVFYRVRLNP